MLVVSSESEDDYPPRRADALRSSHIIVPDRKSSTLSKTARCIQGIKCLYSDTDNLNIEKIATDVIAHLRRMTTPQEIEHLKQEIASRKKTLEDGLWTRIQYDRQSAEIQKLEQELSDMATIESRYKAAIAPVIQRWQLCTKTPDACFLTEIDECISMFTKVTSPFVPMAAMKIQSSPTDLCFVCGRSGTMIESVGSSGQLYCKICKSGRQVLSATNGRDVKGGDDSSAGEDDATETDRILLILKRFQGKQPQLPQSVYDSIEAYLNSRSYMKQSEIRELILKNPNERYGTSRALLQEAMRATRNERAYKDINAVAANLWGWELPVLTQDFENLIIADYRMTQAHYPIIRGKRRSRLNADNRLLRHLVTRGFWHPILNDYLGPVTAEVNEYHSNAWEKMCKLSGLPLVPMRV